MDYQPDLSPGYLAQDRSPVLVKLLICFGVFDTIFAVLYLISRIMHGTARSVDVYLMIPAYLLVMSNIPLLAGT